MTPLEDAALVNPNYGAGDEYAMNCVSCVVAYEMRRRGFDVEASPLLTQADDLQKKPWELFNRAPVPCTFARVAEQMVAWGDGARAAIAITVDDSRMKGAHIYVAERFEGRTYFIDPQCPSKNASMFLSHAKTAFFWNIDCAKLSHAAAGAFNFRSSAVQPRCGETSTDFANDVQAVVQAYKAGSTQALNDLIVIMTPFLKKQAVKFVNRYSCDPGFGDSADALQIMYERLMLLVDKYNLNHGVPFVAFLHKRLVGSVYDARFPSRRGRLDPSNFLHYDSSERPEAFLDEMLPSLSNEERVVDKIYLNDVMNAVLDDKERDVVRMRYMLDMSLDDIASTLGVSYARVSQISKKALSKIKRRLSKQTLMEA